MIKLHEQHESPAKTAQDYYARAAESTKVTEPSADPIVKYTDVLSGAAFAYVSTSPAQCTTSYKNHKVNARIGNGNQGCQWLIG